MTEDYLHYLYKHRLFDQRNLKTTSGEAIEIIYPGVHNHNAGPDFVEARIKIGDSLWAGHVELHVRSTDWQRHNHQTDPAYNNVVLHVVYQYDGPVWRQSGSGVPTLVLEGRFDEMGYWQYERFVGNQRALACENSIAHVDTLHLNTMLERTLMERLEEKSEFVLEVLRTTANDWSETFYRLLMYAFGLKVNAEAMMVLAERLPLSILRKNRGSVQQLEALLLGTAGLLSEADEYGALLTREFRFLQNKYNLNPLAIGHLKFARLRPSSFPTVRLAQMAAILNQQTELFRLATNAEKLDCIVEWLQQAPSEYWKNHYRLGKAAKAINKTPAPGFMHSVVINAIVPTLFAYGMAIKEDSLKWRALNWLNDLPAEMNAVVQTFLSSGVDVPDARQSQALLQLYKKYCRSRKCLSCTIGIKILKKL